MTTSGLDEPDASDAGRADGAGGAGGAGAAAVPPGPAPRPTIPPAFVVALAIMGLARGGFALLHAHAATSLPSQGGWLVELAGVGASLLWAGTTLAALALLGVGFTELARRAGPGGDGVVLRIGAVAVAGLGLCTVVGLYVLHWWIPTGEATAARHETWRSIQTWLDRLPFVAALVASGALVVAGRRLRTVRLLAGPLLVATALRWPLSSLRELISYARPEDGELWTQAFIDLAIGVAFAGALFAVALALGRALPPARVDRVRAGQGLERVGSALVARVLILVVVAFTLVMTVGARSPAFARLAALVFPFGLLLAGLALVTGMIQAGGLAAAGAPRYRLYAATALTITALAIEALKAVAGYVLLRRGRGEGFPLSDRVESVAAALPYLTPTLAVAGLLCVLWAAAPLRRMSGAGVDERGLRGAALALIACSGAALGLLRWAETGGVRSVTGFVMLSLLIAVANIIALLAVARICHRVGEALRGAPELPTAVATVR